MRVLGALSSFSIARKGTFPLELSTPARVQAAMRKLLHIAFGVLKSGKMFDPNHELLINPSIDF